MPGPNVEQRVLWMLAGGILVVGIAATAVPLQARLQTEASRAHELYELEQRDARVARAAPAVEAAIRRVSQEVAPAARSTPGPGALVETLRRILQRTRRFHVAVESFAPELSTTSSDATPAIRATLGVRGAYRDLLACVADLSKEGALIEVGDVSLSPTLGDRVRGDLDATVHLVVYPSLDAAESEHPNDRPTPP